jgi:hypothetical protein
METHKMQHLVPYRKGRRAANHAVAELIRWAQELGFTASFTRKGHVCFRKPGTPLYFTPGTPSDWRGLQNARAGLIRFAREAERRATP